MEKQTKKQTKISQSKCLKCEQIKEIVCINVNALNGICRDCFNQEQIKELPKKEEKLIRLNKLTPKSEGVKRFIQELELSIKRIRGLK